MLPHLIVYGAVAYGWYKLNKYFEKKDKEEFERRAKEQEVLWNNGVCPHCGRKWKYRWYFPPGSGGKYMFLSIKCRHCRTQATLDAFVPNDVQPPYTNMN